MTDIEGRDIVDIHGLEVNRWTILNLLQSIYGVIGAFDVKYNDKLMLFGRMFPPENPPAKILEAGCGTAKFSLYYALRGHDVVAMDIDPSVFPIGLKNSTILGLLFNFPDLQNYIDFVEGSVHKIPYEDNTFDFVFNEGVLEHWHGKKRQKGFDEMARVSRNMVAVVSPNGDNPAIVEQSKKTVHSYKGMGKFQDPFTGDELAKRMRDAGLKDVKLMYFYDVPEKAKCVGVWGVKCGFT